MADVDDPVKSAAIAQFVSFTSSDAPTARSYLESTGFDLNAAMNLYLEGGEVAVTGNSSSSTAAAMMGSPEVRAPIPAKKARLYDDFGPGPNQFSNSYGNHAGYGGGAAAPSTRSTRRSSRSIHHAFRDHAAGVEICGPRLCADAPRSDFVEAVRAATRLAFYRQPRGSEGSGQQCQQVDPCQRARL